MSSESFVPNLDRSPVHNVETRSLRRQSIGFILMLQAVN